MAWIKKTKGVPGSAPGGLVWNTGDDVVEVDDELAIQLLEIPDAGFVSVAAPEVSELDPADPGAEGGEEPKSTEGEAKPARKTAASKNAAAKTPVTE